MGYEFDNPDYPVKINFIEIEPQGESIGVECDTDGLVNAFIVNNGVLSVLASNGVFQVSAGQGLVIRSASPYRLVSVGNERCGIYSILFSPEYVIGDSVYFHDRYLKPFENNETEVVKLYDDNISGEEILDGLNRIIASNMMRRKGYELSTKGELCMLWNKLLERVVSKKDAVTGKNIPSQEEVRIEAALAYIADNYMEIITLDEIAEHVHISRGELCRNFKRVMSRTAFDYIMEYRIYQAARILYKNPTVIDSISELAIQTGFNNISYFNKIFKKYTHITPSEFRKMIKQTPEAAEKVYMKLQDSVNVII